MLQGVLFPALQEELGPMTAKQQQVVAVLDMVHPEACIAPSSGGVGRPATDRRAMARAFVAKAIYNLSTTRQLLERLPLSATTPYAGSLVEQGGKLYQQASYRDGRAHAYASNTPTLGGIAAGTYPTPGGPNTAGGTGATYLSLNISGNDAANFMTGQFVTPQFVTDQAMAAQYSSYERTQQSANMQLPGLTVA